jgi:putative transposase
LRQTTETQPEALLDIHRGINAVSEAFNSVLKVEYVHRHTFATRTEARLKIATWITGFYNTRRLHSVCGYHSPIDYERNHRVNSALGLAA